MTDTQTVGNGTEAGAQPTVETPAAQDQGLETLLNEFRQETSQPATQPLPDPKPAQTEVVDTEARRKIAEWEFEKEIKPVIKAVRGDIPEEVLDDDEINGWLDAKAKKDPRLQQAWLNRKSNPAAWNKVEKALSSQLAQKFRKLPDPQATEDIAAVTAAVKGSTNTPPPDKPPNFGGMNNAEYRKSVKEKYGFYPSV